jgi:hypothetical protein
VDGAQPRRDPIAAGAIEALGANTSRLGTCSIRRLIFAQRTRGTPRFGRVDTPVGRAMALKDQGLIGTYCYSRFGFLRACR